MQKKPLKHSNLLDKVRACLQSGNYLDTHHSSARRRQRKIDRLDIQYVLTTGWHEKNKDKFDSKYKAWNYSVRGRTIDLRSLRIVVSFDNQRMIIVTAMELYE